MKPIPSPDWYFRKYPNARNSSREWRKLRYEKALEIQADLPRKRVGIVSRFIGFLRKAVLDDLRRV